MIDLNKVKRFNKKDRTVLIFHKRRRKHSRKKNGHRQRHSKIQITKILSKDGKVIAEAKPIELKIKKTIEYLLAILLVFTGLFILLK